MNLHQMGKIIIFLGCWSLLFSCQEKITINTTATDFFDIPAYFKTEALRLSKIADLKVSKTIKLDGKTESKQLVIDNWAKELALFAKIQIHSPTQREKYQVDSSFAADTQIKTVRYSSDDKKAVAKSVSIDFLGEKPLRIEITTTAENEVYKATQQLIYEPEKGYRIEKEQQVTLHQKHDYAVIVNFEP